MKTLAPDLKGVCTTCGYETEWVGEFEDFNAQLGICPKCEHELELFDGFAAEPEWLHEFESELEAEINRRSKTYIKWVQQQLNRIDAAGLRADGVMGTKTHNAIKAFQKKYSVVLPPDGKPSEKLDSFFIMFGAPPPPGSPKPKSFDPRSLPASVYTAFKQGASAWKTVLQRALDAGITSANKLADIMFFLAHPERKGRQINSSETQAIREWNNWRDKIRPILDARKAAKARVYPSYVPKEMVTWLEAPAQGIVTRRFRSSHPKFSFLVGWKSEKPQLGCDSQNSFTKADRSWFAAERDDLAYWEKRIPNERVARIVADAKRTYNEKIAWYMQEKKLCAEKARLALQRDDKKWLLELATLAYGSIPLPNLSPLAALVGNTAQLIQWIRDRS